MQPGSKMGSVILYFAFFAKLQYLFYKQLDNTEFLFKWLKVYCIVSIYNNDIVNVEMCFCMLIVAPDVLSFCYVFFQIDVMKFGQNDFQLSENKITRCIVEQRLVIDVNISSP